MKTISYTISPEFDEIELHILADLHLGDKHCRMDDIQKQIDRIKDTENAFLILNGDIVNWASKTSISDCYAEALDYGGYGEAQEYKPASTKTPVLRLSGRRKEFDALV